MESIGPFWVCDECLVFIANGDLPEEEERRKEVLAGIGDNNWVPGGSEKDDDEGFSWSSCDCCETTLGGTRHPASVLVEAK